MVIRWQYGNKKQSGQYYTRVPFVQARIAVLSLTEIASEFYARTRTRKPQSASRRKTYTPKK